MLALQILALFLGQSTITQPEFRECPSGVYVRFDQNCPVSGPHPSYIFFGAGEATLTERARSSLDGIVANRLAAGRDASLLPILIESHTDRAGTASYNLILSKRRAEAIRIYLVGRGVLPNAVAITYFGETRAPQGIADDLAEPDRRVAIVWTIFPENFVRSRR